MLRANTKKVQERMVEHIKEFYPDWKQLKEERDMQNDDRASFYQSCRLVEAGCFLVYYNQVRDFIQDIQEMTLEQINHYSDKQLWRKYIQMCADAIQSYIYRGEKDGGINTNCVQ